MKNKFLLILALGAVALFSCKKDDADSDKVDGVDVKNPVYATKTYDQAQKDIENTGVNMVTELSSMNKEKGVQATVNLLDLAASGDLQVKKSYAFASLKALASLQQSNGNVSHLMSALKSTEVIYVEAEFDQIAGTYTYNFTTQEFDQVLNSALKAVVIKFPASKDAKTNKLNDGELKIEKPTFADVSLSVNGESSIQKLPATAGYSLSVSGTNLVTYAFDAKYNGDGIPTDVSSTFTVGSFEFKATWGYSSSTLSINYSFKHGATIIFDLGASADGSFTQESIDNATVTTTKTESFYGQTYTYQSTETYPEKVLSGANAHFQFMNIKFAGKVDFKNLMTEVHKYDETEATLEQETKIINDYINVVVVYADNNEAIAKGEAYITQKDVFAGYSYVNGQLIEKTEKENVVDYRMVFANDKKVDFKTYFESGFNDLISSFNTFIGELNTTYGWKMNEIER